MTPGPEYGSGPPSSIRSYRPDHSEGGRPNEVRLIVTGLLLVLAVSIDKIIEKATGQKAY